MVAGQHLDTLKLKHQTNSLLMVSHILQGRNSRFYPKSKKLNEIMFWESCYYNSGIVMGLLVL